MSDTLNDTLFLFYTLHSVNKPPHRLKRFNQYLHPNDNVVSRVRHDEKVAMVHNYTAAECNAILCSSVSIYRICTIDTEIVFFKWLVRAHTTK